MGHQPQQSLNWNIPCHRDAAGKDFLYIDLCETAHDHAISSVVSSELISKQSVKSKPFFTVEESYNEHDQSVC
jgi:hypothetical protein